MRFLTLPTIHIPPQYRKVFVGILIIGILSFSLYELHTAYAQQQKTAHQTISQLTNKNTSNERKIQSLIAQVQTVTMQYTALENTDANKKANSLQNQLDTINTASTSYASLQNQITQAKSEGINTDTFNTQLSSIALLLLTQKYTDAISAENTLTTALTNAQNQLKQEQAAQKAQTQAPSSSPPAPPTNVAGSSFSVTTVKAQGVNYTVYLISIDLTNPRLRVITDTADSSDCSNNCTVYDLATFYNRNHGFAAINGTYLCPATYSTCAGQTNSTDFPVYNTNLQKWLNAADLPWVDRAMLTFSSSNTPTFYPNSSTYAGQSVHAGFVMAPGLVNNGQVIVNNYPLDSKSATVLSSRGAIGFKGSTLLVVDALNATVPNMAYIMQALGATDAISVDGGGSTAMIYNGAYKLGPGRNIPNAIVFALQ